MTVAVDEPVAAGGDWFDRWFEPSVYVVIAANAVVTVWALADHNTEELFEPAHRGLMVFFAAEMLVRFARVGCNPRRFFKNRWNVFDLSLVILGLLPMLGSGVIGLRLLRLARLARVFHSLRHVSTLRVARITQLFKE